MALRCPRCRSPDIALEAFGVYRCARCGRIDADGRPIDAAAPAAAPSVATFAAPPPKEWTPSDVAAEGAGPPPFFLGMLGVQAVLIVLGAVLTRRWVRLASLAFLVALAFGKPWARLFAIVGGILGIGLTFVLLVVGRGQLHVAVQAVLVADIVFQLLWLYALNRTDTVAFFARAR